MSSVLQMLWEATLTRLLPLALNLSMPIALSVWFEMSLLFFGPRLPHLWAELQHFFQLHDFITHFRTQPYLHFWPLCWIMTKDSPTQRSLTLATSWRRMATWKRATGRKIYFLQYFMEQDAFLRSDRTYMVPILGMGLFGRMAVCPWSEAPIPKPMWSPHFMIYHWARSLRLQKLIQFFQIEKTRVWVDKILPLGKSLCLWELLRM